MDRNRLLSPNFSRKLPRDDDLEKFTLSNQEDIFNIDVDSFIKTEKDNTEEEEEPLDSKTFISPSYSDGANLFCKEEICEKLNHLYNYNQDIDCVNAV